VCTIAKQNQHVVRGLALRIGVGFLTTLDYVQGCLHTCSDVSLALPWQRNCAHRSACPEVLAKDFYGVAEDSERAGPVGNLYKF
jgi:hypothetical protein